MSQAAVLHLLWALDHAGATRGGDTTTTERALRSALARYPGPWTDFEQLRVPEIFAALQTARPAALVESLRILGLLDTRQRVRVVVIADDINGRVWARERGYPAGEALVLRSSANVAALRTLQHLDDPAEIDIVRLGPCTPHVDDVLRVLVTAGATPRPATWRPAPATVHAGH